MSAAQRGTPRRGRSARRQLLLTRPRRDPRRDHVDAPELHQRLPPVDDGRGPDAGHGPRRARRAAAAAAAAAAAGAADRALKKRARDGADETASERADRKSARERRRRAEVGEKFEELTKALGEAEERCAGSVPRRDAVSEGNRVDLLQRAIDVVRALTKACVDAETRGCRRSGARAAAAAAAAAGACPVGRRRPDLGVAGAIGGSGAARRRVAQRVRAARRRRRRGRRRGCLYSRHVVCCGRRADPITTGPADAATFDTGASAGRGGAGPVAASALRGGAAAGVSLDTVPRGPVAGADADGPAARAVGRRGVLLRARGVRCSYPPLIALFA